MDMIRRMGNNPTAHLHSPERTNADLEVRESEIQTIVYSSRTDHLSEAYQVKSWIHHKISTPLHPSQ